MIYNTCRPHTFSEVVGQKTVVASLQQQSKEDKFFSAYILCGQFGSGKTTMARILAMAANCKDKDDSGNPCCRCTSCKAIMDGTCLDVEEVAAAVDTGVGKVREICEKASYQPSGRKKVFIIDEVQALSKAAFQAFLKILEEPPAHVMFVLATTDVSAIPPTIRSRAATYFFTQLSQEDISNHLFKVAEKEALSVSKDATAVIAKYSQGSMRNALSLLEMASFYETEGTVTGSDVEKMLGVSTPDALFSLITAIVNGNTSDVVRQVTALSEGGSDLNVMVGDLIAIASDLAIASVTMDAVVGSEHYMELLRTACTYGTPACYAALVDGLLDCKIMLRKQPELSTLTVALIRLSRRKDVVYFSERDELLQSLLKKVSYLEKALENGNTVGTEMESSLPVSDGNDGRTFFSGSECEPVETDDVIDESSYVKPIDKPIVKELEESEVVNEKVSTIPEENVSPFSLFSFLMNGFSSEVASTPVLDKSGKSENRQLKLLAKEERCFAAALDCCEIEQSEESAVIISNLPAVKKFIVSWLKAFDAMGFDVKCIIVK